MKTRLKVEQCQNSLIFNFCNFYKDIKEKRICM